MKKVIYFMIFIVCGIEGLAQEIKWVHQFGGEGEEVTAGIVSDAAGNIISTGWFTESATFGPPTGGITIEAQGFSDMYVSKTNSNGDLLWVKSFPATSISSGNALAVDNEGNIYLGGSFTGLINLNTEEDPYILETEGEYFEQFLLKLNEGGDFIWARTIKGSDNSQISDIVVDNYQSINVLGYFFDTIKIQDISGEISRTSKGSLDIFIAKYSSEGEIYWVNQFGGDGLDIGSRLAVNEFSDLYVTGMYMGTAYLNDTEVLSIENSDANGLFLLKFNMMGEGMSSKIGEILSSEEVPSIGMTFNLAVDQNSNVYVCGDFVPEIEFIPKENGEVLRFVTNNANPNGFVAKIHSDGYLEWANHIEPNTPESASVSYGIALTPDNEVYLMGYAGGNISLDNFNIQNSTLESYLAKLNEYGEFIYVHPFGKSYFVESSRNIILTPENDLYLAGTFQDDVDLSPHPSQSYPISSRGFRDIFVMKISADNLGLLENQNLTKEVMAFPNPTKDFITFSSADLGENQAYLLYDLKGNLVSKGTLLSSHKLDFSYLPKGVYIVKIIGYKSIKVMKK